MTRRRLVILGSVVLVLAAGGWLLRQWSLLCTLPPEVRARMPWHFRIPGTAPPAVRQGLRGVYAREPSARYEAAETLANHGRDAEAALPWLLAMLAEPEVPGLSDLFNQEPKDDDVGLLIRLCRWIGWLDADGNIDPMQAGMQPGAAAARALVEIGDAAVPGLLAALDHPLPRVRARAAAALGIIGDPRAVEPLTRALADTDPLVRVAAGEALGGIPDASAITALAPAVRDADQYDTIRVAAAEDLGEWGDRGAVLFEMLHDPDPFVRACAARGLAWHPKPPGGRVESALIEALEDDDGRVVAMAAGALSWFKCKRAVPPLVAALRHGDDESRQGVATALGKIGDPRAVGPLIEALRDENASARWCAIEALGRFKDPRVVDALCGVVARPDHDTIREAVRALAAIGDPAATETLVAALGYQAPEGYGGYPDADEEHQREVREAVLDALLTLGDPRGIPALIEKGAATGYHAGTADQLAALGDAVVPQAVVHLDSADPNVRRLALEILQYLPAPQAFERLRDMMRDALEEEDVRSLAAVALGKTGDPRAYDALMAVVYDPLPIDEWQRMNAIEGLAQLGDPRAADPLLAFMEWLATEPPCIGLGLDDAAMFRAHVARALRLFGDPRAVPMYLDLLHAFGTWPHDVYDPLMDLPSMGEVAAAPLADALHREDPWALEIVARVLAQLGVPAGYDALRKALPVLSPEHHELAACHFLNAWYGDGRDVRCEAAVDLFVTMLETSPSRHARRRAAEALRLCGDRRALPAMRCAAEEDPCLTVRRIVKREAKALEDGRPLDDEGSWRDIDDPSRWWHQKSLPADSWLLQSPLW